MISGLRAAVGGQEILRGVDLGVESGQVHAVMGPNGSGKSTLAHVIMGKPGYEVSGGSVTLDGTELLGLLNIYHDRPREWTDDELDTLAALATQAGVAIKTAQNYTQMATWAAQLQSIQQLGARLNRLTSVHEIGLAIATELRQLLDYHNVRVYRLYGDDLIPVAMQGQVGEYVDETPEQLRIKVGHGITGWVAANKQAQNLPDAASDPTLKDQYDWVVVDSPPVMAVTDACIIAHDATGVLFVVGAEMTSRDMASVALDQLEGAQAKFVGAVLNRVELKRHGYYYSRYYRKEYVDHYAKSAN